MNVGKEGLGSDPLDYARTMQDVHHRTLDTGEDQPDVPCIERIEQLYQGVCRRGVDPVERDVRADVYALAATFVTDTLYRALQRTKPASRVVSTPGASTRTTATSAWVTASGYRATFR